MEYASKLTIDRDRKKFIFNEEAIQSLDADSGNAKMIIIAPIKEVVDSKETPSDNITIFKNEGEEKAIYIINVTGSNIAPADGKADSSYMSDLFPKEKIRNVELSEDGTTAEISIDDTTIESINKMFGVSTKELKLQYQENVVGDMKTLKETFDIKGVYHRFSKVTSKKNVIGKNEDEIAEKIVKLKI